MVQHVTYSRHSKETCARRESPLTPITLKCQNPSSAIPPPTPLHHRMGKSAQKADKISWANTLTEILGSSKKLLSVQNHHRENPYRSILGWVERTNHMKLRDL